MTTTTTATPPFCRCRRHFGCRIRRFVIRFGRRSSALLLCGWCSCPPLKASRSESCAYPPPKGPWPRCVQFQWIMRLPTNILNRTTDVVRYRLVRYVRLRYSGESTAFKYRTAHGKRGSLIITEREIVMAETLVFWVNQFPRQMSFCTNDYSALKLYRFNHNIVCKSYSLFRCATKLNIRKYVDCSLWITKYWFISKSFFQNSICKSFWYDCADLLTW